MNKKSSVGPCYSAKVVIIGDSGVGKTNLLLRMSDKTFKPNYVPTIGVDFKTKQLTIEGTAIRMQIWDTAGQQRYRTIQTAYYKNAQGIILVYSVDDRNSFQNLESWIKQVNEHTSPQIPKILLCNKIDLPNDSRKIDINSGKKLADQFGAHFLQVSAKQGTNVQQVAQKMAKQIKMYVELSHQKTTSSIRSSELTLSNRSSNIKKSCQC